MEKSNKGILKNIWTKLKSISNRKKYENDETEFINLAFIDLCIYLIFLTITTVFTMSTREVNMYYFEDIIVRLFVNRPVHNQQGFILTFKDLVTVEDWWLFVQTTFLQGISQFGSQDGIQRLALEGHVLIGVPRLRQIRVQNETCAIHNAFRNQFQTCYGKYSKENEDVSEFLNKTYLTQSEINTCTIWGRLASYYGGGYIETLSLHSDENKGTLDQLKTYSWIDRGTRLILIEFALFNANVDLFCNIKLLAEIPPSGGILTSSSIQPLKYFVFPGGYFEFICASIFYGFILYYTLEIILTIIVIGFVPFVHSVWNILDFIVILLGYLSLFYVIWHTIYLKRILHNNAHKTYQYLSFDVICYWNMIFLSAMGLCVFIVWIKIFKFIKLNKTMLQFGTTLRRCASDVLGFAIMFAIVFIAYADLSVLLFGTVHADFLNFPTAVLTNFRMVLGDFNYSEMEEVNKWLAPIYFLSYILFVFFILLNMFLAIINDTYSDVKAEITQGKGNDFKQYLKALFKKATNYILYHKKDIKSVKELEESPIAPKRLTNEKDLTNPDLKQWFEIIAIPRTQEERNALNQRIVMLEQTLESLVKYLDEILIKMRSNHEQPSPRSI